MLDIEEALSRELHEVAGGLHVPALPELSDQPSRTQRYWPLLAAAAAVLVVAGLLAVVVSDRDGEAPEPAPPVPVRTDATMAPYVLNARMYVGGERVPGFWLYVESSGDTWLAQDGDGAWRWGQGTEPNPDDPRLGSTTPVLSPGGAYLAALGTEDGDVVTLIDTTSGEWLGSLPVDLGDPSEPLSIQAVTDDGKVILQSTETSTLWLPLAGNGTVDLNETAPGQVIFDNTPAGLVVMSGDESEKYLAEISEGGELSRTGDLPALDTIEVGPGGQWMMYFWNDWSEDEPKTTVEVGPVDGTRRVPLEWPEGYVFLYRPSWEDDEHLVGTMTTTASGSSVGRVGRCSARTGQCALIDSP